MKAKRIIITFVFALLILGLKAQTQYEYAIVILQLFGSKYSLSTIVEGKSFEKEDQTGAKRSGNEITLLIQSVNKLGKEGWEAYSNTATSASDGLVYTYYFRKKKN